MSVAIRGVTAEFLQKALRRPPAQHRPRGATRRRRRVREEVEVETEVGQNSERRPELLFPSELHPRSYGGPLRRLRAGEPAQQAAHAGHRCQSPQRGRELPKRPRRLPTTKRLLHIFVYYYVLENN